MSFAFQKFSKNPKIFFTPGPAQVYPTFKQHLIKAIEKDIPSLSHRSLEYMQIQKGVSDKLKKMYNIPENYFLLVGSSGTYFMEKIIQNCVLEKSFHFVNGSFSRRFFEIARDLHKKPQQMKVELGKGFNLSKLNLSKDIELITFTACETSTGFHFEQEKIYQIAKKFPQALTVVDMVSAIPSYELDFKFVDAMFFSVQKGLGLPAGLGILVCSPRCFIKSEKLKKQGISTGSYHSFPLIKEKVKNYQTLETPNVLGMYLLNKVLEDMLEYGIAKIREETEIKYQLIKDCFKFKPEFNFYIQKEQERSKNVIVIEHSNPQEVLKKIAKYNFILGGGYGEDKNRQFRIANFPAISVKNMKELIQAFEKEF